MQNELTKIESYLTDAWDMLEMKGATIPPEKNTANLGAAIRSIPGGSSWDPANPTLKGFKWAVDNDVDVVLGTEIPDKYDGNDNPLIVAQKLDSSNNSSYGGAVGYILIRKYVEPTSVFGNNTNYSASTIKNLLDTTYMNNCSDAVKSIISEIDIPYDNTTVKSKFFLMSDTEVCAAGYDNTTEGVMWDYWKQQTGLSSPNNGQNNGRVMRDRSETAQSFWLRSLSPSSYVCCVYPNGYVGYGPPSTSYGVLPACFVGKDN